MDSDEKPRRDYCIIRRLMEMQAKTTQTTLGEGGKLGSVRIDEREARDWNGMRDYSNDEVKVNDMEEDKEGLLDVSQDA